ncbi:hypothetical protein [Maliponia aquimaris]|uniref:hypothetical protein n=1 Tax=Maliponia aquimaris TaxID=1673631 RepID=UPI0011407AD3|nr:hypothetical protein [Maliponia aquimaris]
MLMTVPRAENFDALHTSGTVQRQAKMIGGFLRKFRRNTLQTRAKMGHPQNPCDNIASLIRLLRGTFLDGLHWPPPKAHRNVIKAGAPAWYVPLNT